MYYIHSVRACLPLVFLSSQLGSLELRMKACAMSLWKQQGGWGPRKTHTLRPRFLTATSHSSLFRHPLHSPLLCCQFQHYLYFPIHFSFTISPQGFLTAQPLLQLFPGSDASHHPSSKQREYSFLITQMYFCLISISGAFLLTVFIMGEQQAAMIQVFKRVIRSAFAAWAKTQPVLQTAPCCFN